MRRFVVLVVLLLVSAMGGGLAAVPVEAASTGIIDPQPGVIVSEEPARNTPNILDGTVKSIAQVGNQIVVGGTFTQAENPGSSTILIRNHVLAFDATTGKISTTFLPEPNGTVHAVMPAADGRSVYLGGRFTAAGTQTVKNLIKVDVATGALDPTFTPPNLTGDVRDLEVVGGRLWVAGKFTHIGGRAQLGLGTLNATTGLYDPYFTGVFAGLHNPALTGSVTDVLQIATNPTNTRLMAVGNFTAVNGQSRSQIAMFDISGAAYALTDWTTNLFTSACSSKFDTYMTDVQYSPDGSYFVVSTTGAYGGTASLTGNSGCDVVARFESDAAGLNRATWTAYTGGDSTWAVEVTDKVIYAGGHQRWQNNPTRGDAAGQGAVERTGIAALNPVNGMAYSWNPTRARGVGVEDMLATSQGLYVGSDTTLIGKTAGNTFHARIALMPLAGGKVLPVAHDYPLPAQVYTVATGASQLVRRGFDGSAVTATTSLPTGTNAPAWDSVVGAFMIDGTLYSATSDGVLTRRSFDGTGYGPPSVVNTADALVFQTDWHVTDVPSLTSLFYDNGRIYFTRAGQSTLFYRGFEVEDDIVGQQRLSPPLASGIPYSSVRGAFVAGGKLYYANTTGQLFRADWSRKGPSAGPVGGTSVQVSGPGVDAQDWTSRAMFVHQVAAVTGNRAPTAAATVFCNGLTCTFDGTGSSDPDGDVLSYDWDFGDGSPHDTSGSPTHTYGTGGNRQVTLTVTDPAGAAASTTVTATPDLVNSAPTAAATVSCVGLTCNFDGTASSDPDGGPLSYDWDFGDGTAHGSGATPTHTYAASGDRTVTLTVTDAGGLTGSTTVTATPVFVNSAPKAAATVSCEQLTCSFDGRGSSDPDGDPLSYDWDFGDGTAHGSGATASHTYATAGDRTVTLTVTDTGGLTGSTTTTARPTLSSIRFVAAASTGGNRTSHTVTIPSTVQAGDQLLLFFTANTGSPSYTGPAGWTQIQARQDSAIVARAWVRTAVAGDAGTSVRVTSSAQVKSDITVAAYRGLSSTTPLGATASKLEIAKLKSHVSPTVTATDSTSWLVTYWADRSNGTTAWTAPTGQTVRSKEFGSGSKHMSALLTDGNRPVPAGTNGGLRATANSTATAAASFSVLLRSR